MILAWNIAKVLISKWVSLSQSTQLIVVQQRRLHVASVHCYWIRTGNTNSRVALLTCKYCRIMRVFPFLWLLWLQKVTTSQSLSTAKKPKDPFRNAPKWNAKKNSISGSVFGAFFFVVVLTVVWQCIPKSSISPHHQISPRLLSVIPFLQSLPSAPP